MKCFCLTQIVISFDDNSLFFFLDLNAFWNALASVPLGPLISTESALTTTSTPDLISIGVFPIRDIFPSLPDVTQNFAAHSTFPCL